MTIVGDAKSSRPGISLVMVAFNEAENIGPVARETLTTLDAGPYPYELILVDDGSTDSTLDVMRQIRQDAQATVRVITHAKNGGIGRAVRTGFRAARLDWLTLLPADGQVEATEILKLASAMKSNALVISSYAQRGAVDSPLRMVLSKGLRLLTRAATGVADDLGSIYLFRCELLQQIPLTSTSFFVNLELPLRLIIAGHSYCHLLIDVKARRSGESKVVKTRIVKQIAKELLAFRLALWRERFRSGEPFAQTQTDWEFEELI